MVLEKMSKVMGDVFKQEGEENEAEDTEAVDEGEATLHSAASGGTLCCGLLQACSVLHEIMRSVLRLVLAKPRASIGQASVL